MLIQLIIGSLIICCCVIVLAVFVGVALTALKRADGWLSRGNHVLKQMAALAVTTLWLLAALSISVWVWASVFMLLGLFTGIEEAVYFSIVSFTTLGFGGITLPIEWRILSGMVAANGFILFSLCTAFLIEVIQQVRSEQGEDGS